MISLPRSTVTHHVSTQWYKVRSFQGRAHKASEMRLGFSLLAAFSSLVIAESLDSSSSSPIVSLPYGSFRGQVVGATAQFLGVPFAAPPTGERRFGFPKPPIPFAGIREATEFGAPCPQQNMTFSAGSPAPKFPAKNMSEDCLFINVVRPANISRKKSLPILFWFYGGGFEFGDTSLYPGNILVNRSLALGEPVIFVSANYRLNAFGFLAGKEVKDRGLTNVGLRDQRFALQWVQQNIAAFGGDPTKVTIWGESAGGISVGLHMLFDKGKTCGLFSAAIMQSGSPMRLPDVLEQQVYFDNLASATNCTDAPDRFECLRYAPYPALQSAVDASPGLTTYQNMRLAWTPVVDGTLIPRNPMQLVESGSYTRVPFITGDCEDEGTVFAFSSLNVTTNAQFVEYMKTGYFSYITNEEMQALAAAYPDDVTQGSPFGTGTANAITPEFKRIAAMLGDTLFQAPRRSFLEIASKTQTTYSYRYLKGASTPKIGAAHASDIPDFFGFSNHTDYMVTDALIYFTRKHDPNPPANSISLLRSTHWPKWSSSVDNPPLLSFFDPAPLVNITSDTYRGEATKLMIRLLKK